MRKIKASILGLTLSLLALSYMAVEYSVKADDPNLSCGANSCPSPASCGEAGKANGCTLTCKSGSSVICGKGDDGGGLED